MFEKKSEVRKLIVGKKLNLPTVLRNIKICAQTNAHYKNLIAWSNVIGISDPNVMFKRPGPLQIIPMKMFLIFLISPFER